MPNVLAHIYEDVLSVILLGSTPIVRDADEVHDAGGSADSSHVLLLSLVGLFQVMGFPQCLTVSFPLLLGNLCALLVLNRMTRSLQCSFLHKKSWELFGGDAVPTTPSQPTLEAGFTPK